MQLDLTAAERLNKAGQLALALGAARADYRADARRRVLLDPAGHPFCLTVAPPAELLMAVYGQ
nr:VOC family protein [Saccharomonospora marina]